MIELLMFAFWSLFVAYSLWLFTRAKKPQPLTLDELVILWKLHKRQALCGTPISRVKPILKKNSDELLGFKCQCGYQYLSKRPIAQRAAGEFNMFNCASSKKIGNNKIHFASDAKS
ncbi:MAG TPA: hypothetical protein VIH48_02705 [Candidatus Bathyarchaeia archaeon]